MKAGIIRKYGKENIEIVDMEVPKIEDTEILVEIYAASINPVDFKIKEGGLKILLSYEFPLILGNDFSGKVVEIGKKVTDFKVGDEVYGRTSKHKIGTFAEYIAVDESIVSLKPRNITFEEAASLPLVGLTSYQAINDILKLKENDKLLIQAGSGGIGTFAIQLAKAQGIYVATTVSEKGYDLVEKLGADKIINYKEENFEDVLSNYDAVFDTMGNEYVKRAFPIVKKGGNIVSITALPNKRFADRYKDVYNLNIIKRFIFRITGLQFDVLEKKYDVKYTQLFMSPDKKQLDKITELIESEKILPVVDKIYNFSELQSALDYSKSGRAKGKIVVKIK